VYVRSGICCFVFLVSFSFFRFRFRFCFFLKGFDNGTADGIYAGLGGDDDGEAIYDLVVDQHKSKKPGKGSKRDHIKAEIVDTEKGYLEGIQEVVSRSCF